jgi:hypothetical protein
MVDMGGVLFIQARIICFFDQDGVCNGHLFWKCVQSHALIILTRCSVAAASPPPPRSRGAGPQGWAAGGQERQGEAPRQERCVMVFQNAISASGMTKFINNSPSFG